MLNLILNLGGRSGGLKEDGFSSRDIATNSVEWGTEQTIHGLAGWPRLWSLLISAASATLTTDEQGGYHPTRQSRKTTAGLRAGLSSHASLHAHLRVDLHVLVDIPASSSFRIARNCAESPVQELLEN